MEPAFAYVTPSQNQSALVDCEDFMSESAAVIVTYFPDTDSIENLKRVASLCDKVIVVDNTPESTLVSFPKLHNISVFRFQDNVGLAGALNKGILIAEKEGFENTFLFDQDSRPPDHFFTNMLSFKSKIDCLDSNCVLYVPNFYDRNSKTFAKFPLITRFTLRHATCEDIESGTCDRATVAITSGSLITYSKYKKIGPLREDYFIDFIDNEYCLRIYKLGYRIAVNCDVVLDHAIGKRTIRRFFKLTVKPNNHSALRRYYISRNGVRTAMDYMRHYPPYAVLIAARMGHELLSILLCEDEKYRKIKGMFCGGYHGFTGRMGRCQIMSLMS